MCNWGICVHTYLFLCNWEISSSTIPVQWVYGGPVLALQEYADATGACAGGGAKTGGSGDAEDGPRVRRTAARGAEARLQCSATQETCDAATRSNRTVPLSCGWGAHRAGRSWQEEENEVGVVALAPNIFSFGTGETTAHRMGGFSLSLSLSLFFFFVR